MYCDRDVATKQMQQSPSKPSTTPAYQLRIGHKSVNGIYILYIYAQTRMYVFKMQLQDPRNFTQHQLLDVEWCIGWMSNLSLLPLSSSFNSSLPHMHSVTVGICSLCPHLSPVSQHIALKSQSLSKLYKEPWKVED